MLSAYVEMIFMSQNVQAMAFKRALEPSQITTSGFWLYCLATEEAKNEWKPYYALMITFV